VEDPDKIAELEAAYEQAATDQEAWQQMSMNVASGMDVDDAKRERAITSLAGAGASTPDEVLTQAGQRLEAIRGEVGDERMQEVFGSSLFQYAGHGGFDKFTDLGAKRARYQRADDSDDFEGNRFEGAASVSGVGDAGSKDGKALVWETDSSGDYVYETIDDLLEKMDPEEMAELMAQLEAEEAAAAKKAEEDAALARTAQSNTTRSVDDVAKAIKAMTHTQQASELGGIISRGKSSVGSALDGIMETVSTGGTLTSGQRKALVDAFKNSPDPDDPTANNYTAEEKGIVRALAARDFIYTGGRFGGTITPIDRADDFIGMKPGGALDRGVGGRSVVISNLTINESGNPQKTLRMIKQALRAAGVE
jgi:hypothetical protein